MAQVTTGKVQARMVQIMVLATMAKVMMEVTTGKAQARMVRGQGFGNNGQGDDGSGNNGQG